MAQRPVVVHGGGASSVFWGLVLFFIVLPVMTVLGCFACTGAIFVGAVHTGSAIDREAKERRQEQPLRDQRLEATGEDALAEAQAPITNAPTSTVADYDPTVPPDRTKTDATPIPPSEPTAPPEPARKKLRMWKSADGQFSTEAEFAGLTGGTVTLRKTDGTKVKVPISKLSSDDQEFIEKRHR